MTSTKLIEQITFIRGVEASKFKDEELYLIIREAEGEIAELSKIQNKPEKLKENIFSLLKQIHELVDFINDRNEK